MEIIDWNNCHTPEQLESISTTKNDLGVASELEKNSKKLEKDFGELDCISRADALDCVNWGYSFSDIYKKINELPSVTPQEPQSFKWCTDCKEYDQEKHCCHRWSKVIRDTVEEMKQEPKTGHWILTYGNVECSVCGSVKDSRDVGKATHYCDFCGAKMVEPQKSEVEDGNDDREN